MNYKKYEHALMVGFSEREAVRIGEDACIDEMISRNRRCPEPPPPPCDICGAGDAVTTTNDYLVCSESCYTDAISRERKQ